MKPVKKKIHYTEQSIFEDSVKKSPKKVTNKRDRKLSIYDPLDDEEDTDELDLFDYDLDAIDESEEEDF